MIHDLGDAIERVGKLFRIRPLAVSETRVVRRNEMKAIGKAREERFELSRGSWKSVQQHNCWRVFWTCLAIEDRQSINFHYAIISRVSHGRFLSLCVGEQLKRRRDHH